MLDSQNPIVLTQAEVRTLSLLWEGKATKEIADALVVSTRTTDFHIGNIYRKLGARNRIEAIRAAARYGLVPVVRQV